MNNFLLDSILYAWRKQLTIWCQNGTLRRAAEQSLALSSPSPLLEKLLVSWSSGCFKELPEVVLLPASSMPSAAGAYALATGKIYLNQAWLQAASREAALEVLTEELGHHLDGLLNASDTPGDEGALFAALLIDGGPISNERKQLILADNDHGHILMDGKELSAENSGTSPLNLRTFRFTPNDDFAFSNYTIILRFSSDYVSSGEGNDRIEGHMASDFPTIASLYGIYINGTLKTESGADIVAGYISLGGTNFPEMQGILNTGLIDTGLDNDTIMGYGQARNTLGIVNRGTIDTGEGNDIIKASSREYEKSKWSRYADIVNYGTIRTGPGDDMISADINGGSGISNYGLIDTGSGNDKIEARGYQGRGGTIQLGDGDDSLFGFGIVDSRTEDTLVIGGNGIDSLMFEQSTYYIRASSQYIDGNISYDISKGSLIGRYLRVTGFEMLGGVPFDSFVKAGKATIKADNQIDLESLQPIISLSVSPVSGAQDGRSGYVFEDGSANLLYTFHRTGSVSSSLSVNYTVGGTAAVGEDYTGISAGSGVKTVVFAAGSASAGVIVDPTRDSTAEQDESVSLTLAAGNGYSIGTAAPIVGTIGNDDRPVVSLTVNGMNELSVTEETWADRFAMAIIRYNISVSGRFEQDLTIRFSLGGTAKLIQDFEDDRIVFTAGIGGSRSRSIADGFVVFPATTQALKQETEYRLIITGDNEIEPDESIVISLLPDASYTVGNSGSVTTWILNDDPRGALPVITLGVSVDSISEDGSTSLVYTFTRTGPTSNSLTVNYMVDGTATPGIDYTGTAATFTPAIQTVIFAAGSATATVPIVPVADLNIEPDETVSIWLQSGAGYTVGTSSAVTGTLGNDDFPVITLTASSTQIAYSDLVTNAGWTSQSQNPRFLADVNGDNKADIVAFADAGVRVALANADGSFGSSPIIYHDFVKNVGWNSQEQNPRALADVNGDGRTDIVAFADAGVRVALGNADGSYGPSPIIYSDFCKNVGWTSQDKNPRFLADVNGDGKADIVAFADAGVRVALGKADGTFGPSPIIYNDFGVNTSWTSQDKNPRFLADVNGDGKADIVAFADAGVRVALGKADGTFGPSPIIYNDFGVNTSWTSQDKNPRFLADVNGDGRADIVAFADAGVRVALGQVDGTFGPSPIVYHDFVYNLGWQSQDKNPRFLADENGDGRADIVAFADAGVRVALGSVDNTFTEAAIDEDGISNLIYTFSRTGETESPLTVEYTLNGTATLGVDYSGISTLATTKTVTFAANSSTATVTVDPTADTTIETNETVALTLATGTGYTIGTTAAVVGTILNDDWPVITLAVSPSAGVTEDGTSNLIYTFTRTGATTNALRVNYTVAGSAILGTEYTGIAATPATKSVTFAAGSATATVTVDPTADTTIEPDETVALTLAAGTGYTIGTPAGVVGTITNDDFPSITLAVSPAAVTEDGTANLIYTFARTGATTSALKVNYTVGGTATLGTDYTGIAATPATKSVTFAAGSATATVTVDPTADATIEANETVELTLATGTGYSIGTTGAVVGTISNDDVSSLQTYTMGANDSNLLLLGAKRINGIGNVLNNIITGNGNNNRILGLLGADVLTGGGNSDSDLFAYNSLFESLWGDGNSFDVVTDFSNRDRILAPLSVEPDRLISPVGNIATISLSAISSLLSNPPFAANSVAAFTASGRPGTFVAMNDGRDGFQADSDAILFLQNYALSSTNFIGFA
jgi:hypothetical protein